MRVETIAENTWRVTRGFLRWKRVAVLALHPEHEGYAVYDSDTEAYQTTKIRFVSGDEADSRSVNAVWRHIAKEDAAVVQHRNWKPVATLPIARLLSRGAG